MSTVPNPVCAGCGKPMCRCSASIPPERRFCFECRATGKHKRQQSNELDLVKVAKMTHYPSNANEA